LPRLQAVEDVLANGARNADDPECHPLYPQAVAARQILHARLTALREEIERKGLHVERERILTWIAAKHYYQSSTDPILRSELEEGLRDAFNSDAFEGLVRDGVLTTEWPEAKPGDSGRQFWNFAHWTPALNKDTPHG
jgi:hypothetical protein